MTPAYQNPALAVDAVWIHSGRVLLVCRGRSPFRGQWALPGGFVELRETVEEAVVRELERKRGLLLDRGSSWESIPARIEILGNRSRASCS